MPDELLPFVLLLLCLQFLIGCVASLAAYQLAPGRGRDRKRWAIVAFFLGLFGLLALVLLRPVRPVAPR